MVWAHTNNGMGLGLRTKFRIRLSSLSDVLDGLFVLLMANASSISPVGFSNTQDDGFELKWKLFFVFGFNYDAFDEEEDGSCCTVRYPYHRFWYFDSYNNNDEDDWDHYPHHDGMQLIRRRDVDNVVIQNSKRCLFSRVKMSIVSQTAFNNFVYEANQDILIDYYKKNKQTINKKAILIHSFCKRKILNIVVDCCFFINTISRIYFIIINRIRFIVYKFAK